MSGFIFAWLLACLFLSPTSAVQMAVDDSVLESGRHGTDVVLLSVAYVQQAVTSADHSKLLLRIAYFETEFGSNQEYFNEGMNGGIWAVREDPFMSTQIGSDPLLVQKRELIMLTFGINWEAVQWNELSKPLYSALAAHLVLFAAQGSIPSDIDIKAQALFWRDNYNIGGEVQDFISATKKLEGRFNLSIIVTCTFIIFTMIQPPTCILYPLHARLFYGTFWLVLPNL